MGLFPGWPPEQEWFSDFENLKSWSLFQQPCSAGGWLWLDLVPRTSRPAAAQPLLPGPSSRQQPSAAPPNTALVTSAGRTSSGGARGMDSLHRTSGATPPRMPTRVQSSNSHLCIVRSRRTRTVQAEPRGALVSRAATFGSRCRNNQIKPRSFCSADVVLVLLESNQI